MRQPADPDRELRELLAALAERGLLWQPSGWHNVPGRLMNEADSVFWCGNDCRVPAAAHIEPEPDYIGQTPILHGESERPVPGSDRSVRGVFDAYCLCGHPGYQTCPKYLTGESTVWDLEVHRG